MRLIFFGLFVTALVALYRVFQQDDKAEDPTTRSSKSSIGPHDPRSGRSEADAPHRLKSILTEYFRTYREEQRDYALYAKYSVIFDLATPESEKEPSLPPDSASLRDIGVPTDQIEAGRRALRLMVKETLESELEGDVSTSQVRPAELTESAAIIFLMRYNEILGRLDALELIEGKAADQEKLEEYRKELKASLRYLAETGRQI